MESRSFPNLHCVSGDFFSEQELHELVKKSFFYQAQQTISKLRQQDQSHLDLSLENRINQKINDSEIWVKKAKASKNNDEAMDAYLAAIAECKDCQEAIEGISKSPPDEPSGLQVKDNQRTISLQWQQSKSRGDIIYRIVRKIENQPVHSHDGDILNETTHTFIDDSKALPGQIYYYAVFSIRGEVPSRVGAIAGPVMRIAEIEDLKVIPNDSSLNLMWKAPAMARGVEVWFKEGNIPIKRGDGKKLIGVRTDGIIHSNLKNDHLYAYLIISIFQAMDGQSRFSQGATIQSIPVMPPQPIMDLSINKRDNNLVLNWTHPKKGSVILVYTENLFSFSVGDYIPKDQISSLGIQINIQRMGNTQLSINFQGIIHILPIVLAGDIAIIGEAKSITSISEVANLKGEINSGRIYIEWNWPKGAQKVIVAYRHRNFPKKYDDSSAITKIISKNQYDRDSGFIINKLENKDYYFTFFVVAGEGKDILYSSGKQCLISNSGIEEILYEIKVKKNLFRKIKSVNIILSTTGNFIYLPEMVLVKKNGNLPFRKSDGLIILKTMKGSLNKTDKKILEIPISKLSNNEYGKLFLADDTLTDKYRLMSPKKEKLQLF